MILNIIPSNYERTLKNHFHKNFGINLFLEKYQAYITKIDNDANNKGRYDNFLNDLGIREKYRALPVEDQQIVKEFLSAFRQSGTDFGFRFGTDDYPGSVVSSQWKAETLYYLQCDAGLGI